MSAATVMFQHERVKGGQPLIIETGMDEVSWAYRLNVAKIPTYGGEVIQILSAYIDDMTITGMVRTYPEAEKIYSFFIEYMSIATQGPTESAAEHEHYEQVPMIMTYAPRNWRMYVQPLQLPGFAYSLETVAPRWAMVAHIVDEGLDVKQLEKLVISESERVQEPGHSEEFKITGEISPDSGDPARNPFIAPVSPNNVKNSNNPKEFEPISAEEQIAGVGKLADYYSSLLPNYMNKNFEDILNLVGSKPTFGKGLKSTQEQPEELTPGSTKGPRKKPVTSK